MYLSIDMAQTDIHKKLTSSTMLVCYKQFHAIRMRHISISQASCYFTDIVTQSTIVSFTIA